MTDVTTYRPSQQFVHNIPPLKTDIAGGSTELLRCCNPGCGICKDMEALTFLTCAWILILVADTPIFRALINHTRNLRSDYLPLAEFHVFNIHETKMIYRILIFVYD